MLSWRKNNPHVRSVVCHLKKILHLSLTSASIVSIKNAFKPGFREKTHRVLCVAIKSSISLDKNLNKMRIHTSPEASTPRVPSSISSQPPKLPRSLQKLKRKKDKLEKRTKIAIYM